MKKNFLKYPVTMVEDFTPKEKNKLLDAVLFYSPERADLFDDIVEFWHKIMKWIGIR